MTVNLNNHESNYRLFDRTADISAEIAVDIASTIGSLCMVNGLVYTVRHFQQIEKENNWGRLALGIIPVIGLISAVAIGLRSSTLPAIEGSSSGETEEITTGTLKTRDREYVKNISPSRKKTIKLVTDARASDGTEVHGDRVFKTEVAGKDWFVKTNRKGKYSELVLSYFYSLFAPHSPLVRRAKDGNVAYKGIKAAQLPSDLNTSIYRGLGSALFLCQIMNYHDRQLGNALIDADNHFVLIDYEFSGLKDCYLHSLYNLDNLAPFMDTDSLSLNSYWRDEVDDALINFLIFQFDEVQSFGDRLDLNTRLMFQQQLNNMKSIQETILDDLRNGSFGLGSDDFNRLREKVEMLRNTKEPLVLRFKHSPLMRVVDIQKFEANAKEKLDALPDAMHKFSAPPVECYQQHPYFYYNDSE